jgi:hypothetical protein
MGKKNGKWVVGGLLVAVGILAYLSVLLKKDIMKRGAEVGAAEAAAETAGK